MISLDYGALQPNRRADGLACEFGCGLDGCSRLVRWFHGGGLVIAMKFRAEQYFQASQERMVQATKLWSDGKSFALSMYCGGLAVESLLRAFRWIEDPSFEGRHDLRELLKASRLLRIDDNYQRRKRTSEEVIRESTLSLKAAVEQVVVLWHNNPRFASEDSAKAFLIRIGRFQGIKGDPLKQNARELIGAAQTIMDRGVVLWEQERKSRRP